MAEDFAPATLEVPDGARLHVYTLAAAGGGAARGTIQICHGLAEHAARYGRFAQFLSGVGCNVIAHDQRGHGATQAPGSKLGVFRETGGWDAVVADTQSVSAHARILFGDVPQVIFGHSMGGLTAMSVILNDHTPYRGAAIWNANFSAGVLGAVARSLLAMERRMLGAAGTSRALPLATFKAWNAKFKPNRTAFDWLSRDAAEVDKYVADPLCGFDASVAMWQDVFQGIGRGADDRLLAQLPADFPLHLVGGEKDPATEGGKAVTALAVRLEKAGNRRVTCKVYPETRHETLNEINRDAAMAEFANWLDGAL